MWKTPSALVGIVLCLLAIGIVMLASASGVKGESSYGDAYHFVKRQGAWLVVAALAALLFSLIDYHHWQRFALPLAAISIALLALVFVPGIGVKVGGSRRWLSLGPMRFQPSEFAKIAMVMVLAWWMSHEQARVHRLSEGLLLPGLMIGPMLGLILIEPDLGTTILLGLAAGVMLYLGGTRASYLAVAGLGAVLGLGVFLLTDQVRLIRFLSFLFPERYPAAAYQLLQSKDAFVMGGPWGVGFGESLQKYFYLPEAHTDFILPIIGEELGMPGSGAIAALFAGILICGLIVSLRAPDRFGRLLGLGLTTMVTLQAVINVAVVTGCLPTKGLPLPFISYGGSSLLMSLAGIGMLINIARHGTDEFRDVHTRVIQDRFHNA